VRGGLLDDFERAAGGRGLGDEDRAGGGGDGVARNGAPSTAVAAEAPAAPTAPTVAMAAAIVVARMAVLARTSIEVLFIDSPILRCD
jgi:hypothetical protein